MSIYIPKKIKIIIITNNKITNNKIIILFNNERFILIQINSIKILNNSNILIINFKNFISLNTNNNTLNHYLYSLNNFFIKKIKFTGKGYKILKNKNYLCLIFNHSHLTWFIYFNIICYRLRKQKYIFIYKNFFKLNEIVTKIYNIRPINVYTRRGIRLTKQKIYKKIGKRTT